LLDELDENRSKLMARIETLRSELVTSESRIFEDMRDALDDPVSRAKVAGAPRLLIDRINLLPIHLKTGAHRHASYLLWVEVLFHNGRRRSFLTDQDGAAGPLSMVDGKNKLTSYVIDPDAAPGWSGRRREILSGLIGKASDAWRDRLREWAATADSTSTWNDHEPRAARDGTDPGLSRFHRPPALRRVRNSGPTDLARGTPIPARGRRS
jgi:hypothetical protein